MVPLTSPLGRTQTLIVAYPENCISLEKVAENISFQSFLVLVPPFLKITCPYGRTYHKLVISFTLPHSSGFNPSCVGRHLQDTGNLSGVGQYFRGFRIGMNSHFKVRPFVASERQSCPDIIQPFHWFYPEPHFNLSLYLLPSLSKILHFPPILLQISLAILSMSEFSSSQKDVKIQYHLFYCKLLCYPA